MLQYKYITEENLNHLKITVTNNEMFKEVDDFNNQMLFYRTQKKNYDNVHYYYFIINFLILLVGIMCFDVSGDKLMKSVVIIPTFIISFVLVIGLRRNYNVFVTVLITSSLMMLDIRYGILVMLNIALSIVLKKGDYLKKQIGYPAFNELFIYVDKKNFTN